MADRVNNPSAMGPSTFQLEMFAPQVTAEDLYSTRLRAHLIDSDAMKPTLNPGDLVMVAPAHRYSGEGLYLVECGGFPNVYRVHHGDERGKVFMKTDNPASVGCSISRERFDERVIGKVVALVHVLDSDAFRGARSFN